MYFFAAYKATVSPRIALAAMPAVNKNDCLEVENRNMASFACKAMPWLVPASSLGAECLH
jgi:hypothetical protein